MLGQNLEDDFKNGSVGPWDTMVWQGRIYGTGPTDLIW